MSDGEIEVDRMTNIEYKCEGIVCTRKESAHTANGAMKLNIGVEEGQTASAAAGAGKFAVSKGAGAREGSIEGCRSARGQYRRVQEREIAVSKGAGARDCSIEGCRSARGQYRRVQERERAISNGAGASEDSIEGYRSAGT